jgi:hypothetical protein
MESKAHGSKEYHLMYAQVITAARYRGTVTYQELADLVGLPLTGHHMSSELGAYLGAIAANEVNQGRPMLSAIAVSIKGTTSEGFFAWAKELAKLQSDDQPQREAFWEAEKKAVYQTWQRTFKTAL